MIERWARSLAGLGKGTASAVNGFYGALGAPGKLLQDFLNGTWLGHALHPVLTDVVVGGFTMVLVLDLVSLVFGADLATASLIVLGFAILAALGSAATGLTDFKDTAGTERNVAALHGWTNIVATLIYLVAFFVRLGGALVPGQLLSIVGFVVVSFGAYVGGEVVFNHGSMVNHHAFGRGKRAKEFTAVLPAADLPEATPTAATLGSTGLVLVRRGDLVWALNATCSHAGGPLAEGKLEGDSIVCPWHSSQFRLADGGVVHGPATYRQPAYRARISGEQVEVQGPIEG